MFCFFTTWSFFRLFEGFFEEKFAEIETFWVVTINIAWISTFFQEFWIVLRSSLNFFIEVDNSNFFKQKSFELTVEYTGTGSIRTCGDSATRLPEGGWLNPSINLLFPYLQTFFFSL